MVMVVALMAPAASGVTVANTGPSSPFQCRATGVFFGARANADPVTVTWRPAWPELELRFKAARFVQAKAAEARARMAVAAATPAATPTFLVTDGMADSLRRDGRDGSVISLFPHRHVSNIDVNMK